MKKKVLSLLLAVCLIVGMLPLAASAAGEPFQVDGTGYETLAAALSAADSARKPVEVVGAYTVTSDDASALQSATADINIVSGGSIEVSLSSGTGLFQYPGTITVVAGGELKLPALTGSEVWFGGENARFNIKSGDIKISGLKDLTTGGCEWTLSDGAQVEVPAGKTAFLQFSTTLSDKYGVELVVPENATLDVKGTVKAISGTAPSKMDIQGTVSVNEGAAVSVAMKATAKVGTTGKLNVANNATFEVTPNSTNNNITLSNGAVFSAPASVVSGANWLAAEGGNSLVQFTDENGNVVTGAVTSTQKYAVNADGDITEHADLSSAITAANQAASATITMVQDDTLNSQITTGFNKNVTLVVPTGKTLTVGQAAAAGILTSTGTLRVKAGGTLNLPKKEGGSEDFIGGSSARLNLTKGAIDLDIGEKTVYVRSGAEAEVPSGKTTYLLLGTDGLDAVIEKDAKVTVAGTLKAVSGTSNPSEVTVNGTLDVTGMLTVAEKATVNVGATGTLNLPLMSREDIQGKINGEGVKGMINVSAGGTVKYATYPVFGTDAMVELAESATASMSLANITKGTGVGTGSVDLTINGNSTMNNSSTLGKVLTRFALDNKDYAPLNVKVRTGTITIPEATKVAVVNGSTVTLESGAVLELNGQVDINSTAKVSGNINVNATGTLALLAKKEDVGTNVTGKATLKDEGALVLAHGDISSMLANAEALPAGDSKLKHTTVSTGNEETFENGWEYKAPSTGGGGGTGSTSYTVTVNSAENGKVTASPTSAAKGDKVTLTVSPAEGYELGTLTVKDASGKTVLTTKVSDTEYTFTMPEGSVTVSATFVEKNATPFTDVKTSDWWYEAVKYVYENKLMAGTSTTTFAPTAKLNRAQAVQILYNLEGQPAVTGTADFTDTAAAGDWAVKAITWGAKNNVVAGVGDGKFDPTANVTREQFAQMMYNYAKYKGYDLSAAGDLNNFSDVSKVSDWAKTALSWANGEGLINGNENGTLNPVGTAIRGEAASIMSKFDQNVAK